MSLIVRSYFEADHIALDLFRGFDDFQAEELSLSNFYVGLLDYYILMVVLRYQNSDSIFHETAF